MTDTYNRVIEFLKDRTEEDLTAATENSQLIADLGLNSLSLIEMVNDAEETFDIVIEDEELASLATIGDIVNLLEKKKGNL